MAGGSREAAAEQVLHPRVEIQSQVSHDESARVQDGVLFGEGAWTDTLGLIEVKSSQARRVCHVTGKFYLRLATAALYGYAVTSGTGRS
jgi:hypothetical protein